ncbi:MAG: hypothetical protein Q9170_004367 [Blastenia crenularia]
MSSDFKIDFEAIPPTTFWFAAVFEVPAEFLPNQTTLKEIMNATYIGKELDNLNVSHDTGPILGLVPISAKVGGLLSCTTALLNVKRPINFHHGHAKSVCKGLSTMQQGIRAAVVGANKTEDIASGFATAYDQTILSLLAGNLVERPALAVTYSDLEQMTRIPPAPLITLIVLDLIYAAIGTILMIAACTAVREGRSVRNAQARLNTLAIMAESFENPEWGDYAKSVDMLFAERRGESTRRIALVERRAEKRRFKQIVIPPGKMEENRFIV